MMSDPNAQQLSGNHAGYPQQYNQPQEGQQPATRAGFANYKFFPEELRVLKACQSEAFYYRCLPYSIISGAAAYFASKQGYLKISPKYGPWPRVLAFGFMGYIGGRISYMNTCQEKIMALPNSRLGEMLRQHSQRKSCKNWEFKTPDPGVATALSLGSFQSTKESYSDYYNQPNSLNLDTNRPQYSGLQDYTPTMEGTNDLNEDLAIPVRKSAVTYDELRQKNRDQFAKNQPNPYNNQHNAAAQQLGPSANIPDATIDSEPTNRTDFDQRRANYRARRNEDFTSGQTTTPKNKYGNKLNAQNHHIKFKLQEEENGSIAFLDLEIIRNGSRFDFKIYRKPTDTDRIITNTSFHAVSQRQAAINSMAFRLCNIPLNEENYKTELDRIHKIARINGIDEDLVNKIVEKHKRKFQLRQATTLIPAYKEKPIHISFNYFPQLTNTIKTIFHKHGVQMAFTSSNKLKNILGSTKDKTEWEDKSGIYLATCPVPTCQKEYVGKCKRRVKKRRTEHLRYIKNKEVDETAFTEHCVQNNHKPAKKDFKLLHEVRNVHHLDLIESLYIYLHREKVVNKDQGNAYSHLFESI